MKKVQNLNKSSIEEWINTFPTPSMVLDKELSVDLFLSMGLDTREEIQSELEKDIRSPMEGSLLPTMDMLVYRRWEGITKLKITPMAVHFIARISNTPGIAVMNIWYILKKAKDNNANIVNVKFISTKCFPLGLFTEDQYSSFWKDQKYITSDERTANMVDRHEFGESILEKLNNLN